MSCRSSELLFHLNPSCSTQLPVQTPVWINKKAIVILKGINTRLVPSCSNHLDNSSAAIYFAFRYGPLYPLHPVPPPSTKFLPNSRVPKPGFLQVMKVLRYSYNYIKTVKFSFQEVFDPCPQSL